MAAARSPICSIDVVAVAALERELGVLLARSDGPRSRERWILPHAHVQDGSLDSAAARVARNALGKDAAWLEQVGAFTEGRHPTGAPLSVGYLALVPASGGAVIGGDASWFPLGDTPPIPPRHAAILDAARAALRSRVAHSSLAFHLLPPAFTLGEVQRVYELLMERDQHKASFRRVLQAARLVEPTGSWRTEGRGRPAQLFRFAPRKRRRVHRGVRFDP